MGPILWKHETPGIRCEDEEHGKAGLTGIPLSINGIEHDEGEGIAVFPTVLSDEIAPDLLLFTVGYHGNDLLAPYRFNLTHQ